MHRPKDGAHSLLFSSLGWGGGALCVAAGRHATSVRVHDSVSALWLAIIGRSGNHSQHAVRDCAIQCVLCRGRTFSLQEYSLENTAARLLCRYPSSLVIVVWYDGAVCLMANSGRHLTCQLTGSVFLFPSFHFAFFLSFRCAATARPAIMKASTRVLTTLVTLTRLVG